jgi:hypothetical protein
MAGFPSPDRADPDGYCEWQEWGDTVEKVRRKINLERLVHVIAK